MVGRDWASGSAAASEGEQVEAVGVADAGHLMPFENPKSCAEAIAEWTSHETDLWKIEDERFGRSWKGLSWKEKEMKAEAWMERLKSKI